MTTDVFDLINGENIVQCDFENQESDSEDLLDKEEKTDKYLEDSFFAIYQPDLNLNQSFYWSGFLSEKFKAQATPPPEA